MRPLRQLIPQKLLADAHRPRVIVPGISCSDGTSSMAPVLMASFGFPKMTADASDGEDPPTLFAG
jgi:hypothetical protein